MRGVRDESSDGINSQHCEAYTEQRLLCSEGLSLEQIWYFKKMKALLMEKKKQAAKSHS